MACQSLIDLKTAVDSNENMSMGHSRKSCWGVTMEAEAETFHGSLLYHCYTLCPARFACNRHVRVARDNECIYAYMPCSLFAVCALCRVYALALTTCVMCTCVVCRQSARGALHRYLLQAAGVPPAKRGEGGYTA